MKSEKRKSKIKDFWNWFREIADKLTGNVESPELLREVDNRVRDLDPKLSWEIGPGLSKPWQFVISPNLDRELRETTREIVSCAPSLATWEFHSARQPKDWDYKLELENPDGAKIRHVDASAWTFVLLRSPNGDHEILLKGDVAILGDDERWQAAAITLESILGEDIMIDRIQAFELVSHFEPRFAERARPIHLLRDAVGSAH